jgi:hypothetical protein
MGLLLGRPWKGLAAHSSLSPLPSPSLKAEKKRILACIFLPGLDWVVPLRRVLSPWLPLRLPFGAAVDSFEEVRPEVELPVLGPQEDSRVGGVSWGLAASLPCALIGRR